MLRSDISTLQEEHPDIAERVEQLRTQLDGRHAQEDPQSYMLSLGNRTLGSSLSEADEELTDLIVGIRTYPGFEKSLLPPDEKHFRGAASRAPVVVINMNYHHCDAFIIKEDGIDSLPLPKLKEADINERLKGEREIKLDSIQSADTLEWLWDVAVELILAALGYTTTPSTDAWLQVWWVLTGPLSWFPIHAAGKHTEGTFESTLDRNVSSYSPSVKSLINGRTRSLQDSARSARARRPSSHARYPCPESPEQRRKESRDADYSLP